LLLTLIRLQKTRRTKKEEDRKNDDEDEDDEKEAEGEEWREGKRMGMSVKTAGGRGAGK
jgi:hypothetical protein